jgi:hypothetical protein
VGIKFVFFDSFDFVLVDGGSAVIVTAKNLKFCVPCNWDESCH